MTEDKLKSQSNIREETNEIEIKSEPGKQFLQKYDEPTKGQYRSRLKMYLAFRRLMGNKKMGCDDLKEEAREDWKKSKRERDFISESWVTKFQKELKDLSYSSHTIANVITCLRAFYKFHQYPLNTDRIKKTNRQNKNSFKRIEKDDVRKLYNSTTSKRNKALLLFLYQTGQAAKQVTDLNYGDVKHELEGGKEPLMIEYSGRKRTGSNYVTFLGTDGVHALENYREERESKLGRKLKHDDPLFASEKNPEKKITPASVASMMSYLAKKAGLVDEDSLKNNRNPYRPHAFRHNFKSQLATKCSNFVVEYLMGHEMGVEKDYFLADFDGKEGLRKYYARNIEPELNIEATSAEKEAIVSEGYEAKKAEKLKEMVGATELEKEMERWKKKWRDERMNQKALEEKVEKFDNELREIYRDQIFDLIDDLRKEGVGYSGIQDIAESEVEQKIISAIQNVEDNFSAEFKEDSEHEGSIIDDRFFRLLLRIRTIKMEMPEFSQLSCSELKKFSNNLQAYKILIDFEKALDVTDEERERIIEEMLERVEVPSNLKEKLSEEEKTGGPS